MANTASRRDLICVLVWPPPQIRGRVMNCGGNDVAMTAKFVSEGFWSLTSETPTIEACESGAIESEVLAKKDTGAKYWADLADVIGALVIKPTVESSDDTVFKVLAGQIAPAMTKVLCDANVTAAALMRCDISAKDVWGNPSGTAANFQSFDVKASVLGSGQWHALTGCYGQHCRPVARSNWLLWPTPQGRSPATSCGR